MTVFLSYSRKDLETVQTLAADLARARIDVWLDQELRGGDPWWQDILEQIRQCDVFLVALSANSLASKPCRAELGYARDLSVPILPVQIGPVANVRATPVADIQIVDYRDRSAHSGIALVAAVQEAARARRPLPDPLPLAPPVPFEYLLRLGRAMDASELPPDQQGQLLRQLRDCLETEEDDGVREDARGLLQSMRGRTDVTFRTAMEIDTLLREDSDRETARQKVSTTTTIDPGPRPDAGPSTGPGPGPGPQQPPADPGFQAIPNQRGTAAGWYPDPGGSPALRYWDGARWTEHLQGRSVAPQPAPPVGPVSRPPATSNVLSIAAFVLAGLAVFLLPIFLGPVAIICGIVGKTRRERLSTLAIVIGVACTLIGILLAVAVYESYYY